MVTRRTCNSPKDDGSPCHAPALLDDQFCFWHSPKHAEEAGEARKLGGIRRRRERAVQGAYDFEGLRTIEQIQRVLEIAVLDALAEENSISRSRTLAYLAQVGLKALEVSDFKERLEELEAAVLTRPKIVSRRRWPR